MELTNDIWIRLGAAFLVLVTSCSGLGYIAGRIGKWRGWRWRACVLMSVAVACLWPTFVIGIAWSGVVNHQSVSSSDLGKDAPAYVFMGAVIFGALLFSFSLPLALLGSYIAWRPVKRLSHSLDV